MKRIRYVDSHTGGEPTRLVLAGFPVVDPGLSLDAVRVLFKREHDAYRRAVAREPRASDILVGAWLGEPRRPGSVASVVFFNNVGYLGMCGHGTIGVIATLAYLGRIGPGVYRLDTPVGTVGCTLHADGRVTVENVPAYRWRAGVRVEVPGLGTLTGDVAWGGNWFFLVDWSQTPIVFEQVEALTEAAWALRQALAAQGITGRDGAEIDHIELFGLSSEGELLLDPNDTFCLPVASTGNLKSCLMKDEAASTRADSLAILAQARAAAAVRIYGYQY
jgi:4-hydroxyproline epimerase